MTLDSPLTVFALAISPIMAAIFVSLCLLRRDSASRPSIIAAIPLCLSSIAILLGQSAAILIAAFNEIATRKAAGVGAVISALLRVQRPLIWGFLESGACLIIILLVSAFLKYSGDEDAPLIHAYVSLPALITTAVVLVAFFLMVYLQYGTVDLVMMIVDNRRNQELASQFGMVSPSYYASKISSKLVAIFFLSISQFFALIIAGVLDLFWRQRQNSRQAFATILTLGALVGCGVSALNELGFVDYLLQVH